MGGQTMGRTILPVPLARRVIAILRQLNFFAYSSSFNPRENDEEVKRNWVLTAFSLTVRAFISVKRVGVLGVSNCEIPVCSRRFVWRMEWMVSSVAEPVRECPANERGVRSIHPSIHPVDARQAYCSILRPAFDFESLCVHVRVCGWVDQLVGVHLR